MKWLNFNWRFYTNIILLVAVILGLLQSCALSKTNKTPSTSIPLGVEIVTE